MAVSYVPDGFSGLGYLISDTNQNSYDKFSVVSPNTVSYNGGKAQFTSSYYSNMTLRVKDITDGTTNLYQVKNAKRILTSNRSANN